MDYKLENGLIIKLNGDGKEVIKTYLAVRATGYHGDMDFEVNKDEELYFNDNKEDFKKLICFLCFIKNLDIGNLKDEYIELFDEDDYDCMVEEWNDFFHSGSEQHDEYIDLDRVYWYVIDGKKYDFKDVELDIFEEINE
jgi:hypothetical protein